MRTLILVDLDNVLRPDSMGRSEGWYLATPDGLDLKAWTPGAGTRVDFVTRADAPLSDDGTVVVIAFHELTALPRAGVPLQAHYLLDLARDLAARARVRGEVRVEAIPVRAVPQAADLALLTALRRASHSSCSGGFNRVVLHSRDAGLRGAVALHIPPGTYRDARRHSPVLPVREWTLAFPHYRMAERPTSSRADRPTRPTGWSGRVETDEHVCAVTNDVITWDSSQEFSSFARHEWRQRTEHYSLLGPTLRSSRGVARLGELASSSGVRGVSLGELEVGDGAEIAGSVFSSGSPTEVVEATIGVGAVRLPELQATLPTAVPLPVVREAVSRGALALRRPELSERDALRFSAGRRSYQPSPAYLVRVRRRRYTSGSVISFSLESSIGTPPAWWWDARSTPRAASERTHPLPPRWRVTETLAEGCLTARGGREVCVAAPEIAEVGVRRFHDGWEIVAARSGRREALVLLPPPADLGREISEPGAIEVRRIQRVADPPSGWPYEPTFWYFLARMPLLVPCQWATARDVSISGVAR
jgi:hypothetical protein